MERHLLRNRWLMVCDHYRVDRDRALLAWREIETLYAKGTRGKKRYRFYHMLDSHIGHMLKEFDEAWHLAQDPWTLLLALIGHDIICDPHLKDNEEQSARVMREIVGRMIGHLDRFGSENEVLEKQDELILDTKHNRIPRTADGKLLVDIDLAILGAPPAQFEEYDANIGLEYAFYPREVYRPGRANVLTLFLPPKRPHIYYTPYFRRKYEKPARENLKRKIAELSH